MELPTPSRSSSAFAALLGRCLLAAVGTGTLVALILGLGVLLLAGISG